MGRIEEGSADADLLRSVLELLDSASFDPQGFLIHAAWALPYLGEVERNEVLYRHFEHALVAAYGEPQATLQIYLGFMRWHCLRYLMELEPDNAQHLEELLELFPENSALQARMGERLTNQDPATARVHLQRALKLDPSDAAGCGAQLEALQALAA